MEGSAVETAASFRSWMRIALDHWPGELPAGRHEEYASIVDLLGTVMEDARPVWAEMPRILFEAFSGRGWNWNGFYVREGDALHLGHSAAAPGVRVCASLPREAGAGLHESGMCWDAVTMNQPLYAARVEEWPGYVSCDHDSGLGTVSGLVCPLRGGTGSPIAVWDLDSEAPLEDADPLFMERLLGALDTLTGPRPEELRG